jgi:hypothetical protein
MRGLAKGVFALALLVCAPAAAYAQGSIVRLVKDASGAVLPGVTIEDANLRPGTYTVTFTLPGFSTVKRDGIELTGAFVATVNADLRVGSIAETITVSGETPVFDVQSTTDATARHGSRDPAVRPKPCERGSRHLQRAQRKHPVVAQQRLWRMAAAE